MGVIFSAGSIFSMRSLVLNLIELVFSQGWHPNISLEIRLLAVAKEEVLADVDIQDFINIRADFHACGRLIGMIGPVKLDTK